MRAAISPATIGVEKDVPLQLAIVENVAVVPARGGSWYVNVPSGNALIRRSPGA
jgi:hypothetical protein